MRFGGDWTPLHHPLTFGDWIPRDIPITSPSVKKSAESGIKVIFYISCKQRRLKKISAV